AATLLIVWRMLPRFPPTLSSAIDWRGTALITLSLGAITYALIEGPGRGWHDAVVVAAAAIGVVAFIVFIAVELHQHDPIVPLTTTVMTSIDDERHAGAASGINNTVSRVAGLLAIAVFGAMAITIFARDLDRRLAAEHIDDNVRRAMRQQSLKLAAAAPPP